MNETLQQALATILTKALQTAETAGAFIQGQLPDIAQQYIQYHIAAALAGIASSFLLFLALGIGWFVCYKAIKNKVEGVWYTDLDYCTAPGPYILTGVSVFVGVFSSIVLYENTRNLLLYWFAPKMALIEWASSLVK